MTLRSFRVAVYHAITRNIRWRRSIDRLPNLSNWPMHYERMEHERKPLWLRRISSRKKMK